MRFRVFCQVGLCLVALLCTGCAAFEFDATLEPGHGTVHVVESRDTHLAADPLDYQFRSVEGRLVVRINNPTTSSIELLGTRSTVVDPDGQSHPLRSQSIAPSSYIKEILPPLRPQGNGPPPDVGFGFGVLLTSNDQPGYIRPEGYGDAPAHLDVYDEPPGFYWDWDGQTDVRMTLVFQQGEKTFQHSFLFHRMRK